VSGNVSFWVTGRTGESARRHPPHGLAAAEYDLAYSAVMSRRYFVPPAQTTSGTTPGGVRFAMQRSRRGGELLGSDVGNSTSVLVAFQCTLVRMTIGFSFS
jgi:hypothetical protein